MQQIEFKSSAIDVGQCISKAWELLFSDKVGLYIAASLLFVLGGCLLIFINWFITGPIWLGIYIFALKHIQGEDPTFGDFFTGFAKFLPAMIIGLLIMFPQIVNSMFDIVLAGAQLIGLYNPNELSAAIVTAMIFIDYLLGFIAFILGIAFFVLFSFSIPLLYDHDIGVMEALKTSARAGMANIGGMLLPLLVYVGVIIAGGVALCIGLFLAFPMVWIANAVAYRQVFPLPGGTMDQAPPSPGQYAFDQ